MQLMCQCRHLPYATSGTFSEERKVEFKDLVSKWMKADTENLQKTEIKAVWGQYRVREYIWRKLAPSFRNFVRLPQTLQENDIRFDLHPPAPKNTLGTHGYFCDCDGVSCVPHFNGQRTDSEEDLEPFSTFQWGDMPLFLSVCCKKLPFNPLPRSKADGHFTVLHEKIQKKYTREAWETGVADMRWKCWACLAHSHGSDYDTMCEIANVAKWTPDAIEQRIRQRMRHERGQWISEEWYEHESIEQARQKRLYNLLLAKQRMAQAYSSDSNADDQWASRWDWSGWGSSQGWAKPSDHSYSSGSQPSSSSAGASRDCGDRSRSRGWHKG